MFFISALVAYNSVGLYLLTEGDLPFSAREAAYAEAEEISLTDYFEKKGGAASTHESSFDSLLAAVPSQVLGTATAASPSSSIPNNPQLTAHNQNVTIAVLGDSMIDTLGRDLPHLKSSLGSRFPGTKFNLLNYGVGASNIESGYYRLTNGYSYLGEAKPSLLSQNPDIVVIESFAYNHWDNTQSDLDRQWLTVSKIIDTIKAKNPDTKIVLAATIAPYCPTFTDGSANLPPERKTVECAAVKAYLKNLINFSSSQGYPLANAYHLSLKGSEGNPLYVNQTDHIHPSNEGKLLFSQLVSDQISYTLK